MLEIRNILEENILNETLIGLVISNNKGTEAEYSKVDIDPIILRENLYYQFSFYYRDKVEHTNLLDKDALDEIINTIALDFRQVMIFTVEKDYQILISKKNKIRIIEQRASKTMPDLSHNRKKQYIIEDNIPCDFLIRLNVMNEYGKVNKNMYDKFKQINRFLELVDDVIDDIHKKGTINIIDFGCGKSYLSFALYYYLVKIKKLDVNIIGLDLKKDVIEFCNKVSQDLNYTGLKFIHGDINDFEQADDIDMIVTLHACDTATDAALVKAIDWDVDVILSVPCCQKEVRETIDNPSLNPMLKHGIIKEKLSSIVTDSLRGKVLELSGYEVQLLEFIDIENTPKNILIRAVNKHTIPSKDSIDEYNQFKKFWNLDSLFIEDELKKIDREIKY